MIGTVSGKKVRATGSKEVPGAAVGARRPGFRVHNRSDAGRWRRALCGLAMVAALGGAGVAWADTAPAPHRAVSINLCTDQLLITLADPDAIVSVTRYAADPNLSNVVEAARRYPLNNGAAEAVMTLRADLVVTMAGRDERERRLLGRLGVPVYELPAPETLADLRAAIGGMAERLGRPARGAAVVAQLDAGFGALAGDAARTGTGAGGALFYGPGGYTFGPRALPGAVLAASGWNDVAGRLGVPAYGQIPIEKVLMARPDLLVILDAGGSSYAQRLLRHPALSGPGRPAEVAMPQRLVLCPGPWLLDAARRLAAVRAAAVGAP